MKNPGSIFLILTDWVCDRGREGGMEGAVRTQEDSLFYKVELVLNFPIMLKKSPLSFLCRSCRVAPLIQCDYCPLLFHMDCLEPPLTAMPLGRWMCPNHIEHVVVSTAVSSQLSTAPAGAGTDR